MTCPRTFTVASLLLILLVFVGCRGRQSTDQVLVDSIFNTYHGAASAFDADDVRLLQHFADSVGCHYGQQLAHLDMASLCVINADRSQALSHLEQVDIRPDDPPFVLAYSDFVHGLAHQYNSDFVKALFYYKRASEGFEKLGKKQALATTYTNMSELYSSFEDWDLQRHYSELAASLFSDSTVAGYNVLSDSIYTLIHRGLLSDALKAWRAHHPVFAQQESGRFQFAYVYNHYDQAVAIHFGLANYDSAAYYNDRLMALVQDSPRPSILADLSLSRAQILLRQGRGRQAYELCRQLVIDADSGRISPQIAVDVYPVLMECCDALGLWRESGQVALRYADFLHRQHLQMQRDNLQQGQIEQRYEQLLAQAEHDHHKARGRFNTLVLLSLLVVLLLMAVIIYKQRRQQAEQLLRLNSEQELDAAQHSLAESQMRQAKIQEQILTYTEQMRTLATDMPKKLKAKTFLNLEQIQRQRDADAWDTFEQAFSQQYGNFRERLLLRYPQCNPTDVKICILMRTGMPSRDIANMLHLTPESLRTFRYNLRKKLDLQRQGLSLEEFVAQL